MNLSGVILPLTTPFSGDAVDTAALAANIARYQRHGLAGYLVLGSTGDAALLDEDEKLAVLRAARAAIPRDSVMMAGVGVESTRATVRLARAAADAGADALLVLTPFFFRGRMSADALRRHFEAVADGASVPVLLYNVPMHTSLVIPPAVIGDLARHQNVAGLKDSSGDLPWLLDVLGRVPAGFRVLCGAAAAFLPELSAGAWAASWRSVTRCRTARRLHRRHLAGDRPGPSPFRSADRAAPRLRQRVRHRRPQGGDGPARPARRPAAPAAPAGCRGRHRRVARRVGPRGPQRTDQGGVALRRPSGAGESAAGCVGRRVVPREPLESAQLTRGDS
jgi:dihydrodipicolinate synthase/N-acetylneuraminate lyase